MKAPLICLLVLANLASVALAAEDPLHQLEVQLDSLANKVAARPDLFDLSKEDKNGFVNGALYKKEQAQASEASPTQYTQRLIQKSRSYVNDLQSFKGTNAVPKAYRESLEADIDALRGIVGYTGSPTYENLFTLVRVTDDLRTKVDHLRLVSATYNPAGNAPFPAGFEPISVAVHTSKENKEVSGYEVWFAPAAFGDGSRDRRFDQYSSPTARALAPGNYYLWARSTADGLTGQRQVFEIGKEGQTFQEIHIAAP